MYVCMNHQTKREHYTFYLQVKGGQGKVIYMDTEGVVNTCKNIRIYKLKNQIYYESIDIK